MPLTHTQQTAASLEAWSNRRATTKGFPIRPAEIAQTASRLEALLRAIHRMAERGLRIDQARVLDVGAASGYGLKPFLSAGFSLNQLLGIELSSARVAEARRRLPQLNIIEGDATDMRPHFTDASFELVCEQFCFCHVPADETKRKIAVEILRVTKPGGFILIHDWRMTTESRQIYGVPQKLIRRLFAVGRESQIIDRFPSQLWPPIGRPLSGAAAGLYQLGMLIPWMVGSRITVLMRL